MKYSDQKINNSPRSYYLNGGYRRKKFEVEFNFQFVDFKGILISKKESKRNRREIFERIRTCIKKKHLFFLYSTIHLLATKSKQILS
jgi:hypothetical protein